MKEGWGGEDSPKRCDAQQFSQAARGLGAGEELARGKGTLGGRVSLLGGGGLSVCLGDS